MFEILRDGRVIEHSRKPKPQNLYNPTAQARPSSFVSPKAPNVDETDAETISLKIDGRKRLMEDKEVYKTYYNSIGFAQGMVFLISSIIFAFTLKFPGISPFLAIWAVITLNRCMGTVVVHCKLRKQLKKYWILDGNLCGIRSITTTYPRILGLVRSFQNIRGRWLLTLNN